jgi:hypothetical protein
MVRPHVILPILSNVKEVQALLLSLQDGEFVTPTMSVDKGGRLKTEWPVVFMKLHEDWGCP